MDVAVKGLLWLLEAWRQNPVAEHFVLIGGDAAIGHFFHGYPVPITEAAPHCAYPGCYALSKMLEEVMVEQYGHQYDIDWCWLRAPWIMEKDDFYCSQSSGENRFGGPDRSAMAPSDVAALALQTGAVPMLQETDGAPVKRNFVHVEDPVLAILLALTVPAARQKLYNFAMDEPIDCAEVGPILHNRLGLPAPPIRGAYVSNWIDNSRAKVGLGWRPAYDLDRLITASWAHTRAPDDPRQVWYPG